MEQLQNFGPNDAQNGTLANMFRSAGINDVNSYIDDVRRENTDLNDHVLSSNHDQSHQSSNPLSGFLNNAQDMFQKRSNGKSSVGNVKQMYQMYKSMDKNGDGKITVEDVEIILKEMGLGFVSKHLARAIFNIVDTNHNGQLDFRDLLALTSLLKQLSSSSAKH